MNLQDRDSRICANCLTPLGFPVGHSGRARAVAWMNSCRPCADNIATQMEVVEDRPSGANIQILRCTWCGTTRACRPGWRTRCHVCLDDRTDIDILDIDGLATTLQAEHPDASAAIREIRALQPDEPITDGDAHEFLSWLTYDTELDMHERTGWTLVAGDIKGLPWDRYGSESHGIWCRHDACGAVQNVRRMVDCASCPPEPGSRSHRARSDHPHLLYLVRYDHPERGALLKFGHGDRARVMAHLAGGGALVRVLRATHAQTIAAEKILRVRHRRRITGPVEGLPPSFGRGSEVIADKCAALDLLLDVLPEGEDVTGLFATLAL